MFSKNIRTLYLYVVSFLALMAMIYGTVTLVEKITNYIYPVDYAYDQTYINSYPEKGDYTIQDNSNSIAIQQENTRIRTLREIFTSLAVIVVSVPLYSYHWAMAQKERKKEEV
jgi:hypothetical protein